MYVCLSDTVPSNTVGSAVSGHVRVFGHSALWAVTAHTVCRIAVCLDAAATRACGCTPILCRTLLSVLLHPHRLSTGYKHAPPGATAGTSLAILCVCIHTTSNYTHPARNPLRRP